MLSHACTFTIAYSIQYIFHTTITVTYTAVSMVYVISLTRKLAVVKKLLS